MHLQEICLRALTGRVEPRINHFICGEKMVIAEKKTGMIIGITEDRETLVRWNASVSWFLLLVPFQQNLFLSVTAPMPGGEGSHNAQNNVAKQVQPLKAEIKIHYMLVSLRRQALLCFCHLVKGAQKINVSIWLNAFLNLYYLNNNRQAPKSNMCAFQDWN